MPGARNLVLNRRETQRRLQYFLLRFDDGSYLFAAPEGYVIIDTVTTDEDGRRILHNMRSLGFDPAKTRYIVNTHYHWDHSGGNEEIIRQTGAQVLAGAGDASFLEHGNDNSTYPPKWRFEKYKQGPVPVARKLIEGDTVVVGGATLKVLYTPGHTAGSICLQAEVEGIEGKKMVLFTGDVNGSDPMRKEMMTVTGYPGNVEDFRRTIARLKTVRPDIVLSGHWSGSAATYMKGAAWVTGQQWQSFLDDSLRKMERNRVSP